MLLKLYLNDLFILSWLVEPAIISRLENWMLITYTDYTAMIWPSSADWLDLLGCADKLSLLIWYTIETNLLDCFNFKFIWRHWKQYLNSRKLNCDLGRGLGIYFWQIGRMYMEKRKNCFCSQYLERSQKQWHWLF